VAGKTLRGCYSCTIMIAIHSWLRLIEAWGVVKAHKPRLQCFVLQIQQSVTNYALLSKESNLL